jgi:hypothetical protein
VWDRAKQIFTDPIGRIIAFATSLAGAILGFVREAILRPLAALAEGTRGYDLLKAVLGQDPITGERVPRTAETLIGGFMKLIGQEEVWENLKKANAVPRAGAWFQGALEGLMGFVRELPRNFVNALKSLELADLISGVGAFRKLVVVFAGFLGRFVSWAGSQALSLLQIIFEVLAPGVMPYLRKAAGAFTQIVRNPVGFIKNLVGAGVLGFKQFASNFLSHLRKSLIQWLTGSLAGAGIYIPQAFEIREIIKFVLSVLGLTWPTIRGKLVKVIGETAMGILEQGFDIVLTLVNEGPAAAWEKIKEQLSNLKEMVIEQVMTFVRDNIVQAAITKLLTSLNPVGAFIQAVIAIYNTVMFFVERLKQIAQVAMAFIDSISAIAAGSLGAAANRVEQTMAGLLTLVISFLARIVGLGKVSDAVLEIVKKIRAPIDKALDKVVEWIVNVGRAAIGRKRGEPGAGGDVRDRVRVALTQKLSAPHDREQIRAIVKGVESEFRPQGLARLEIGAAGPDGRYPILAQASPLEPCLVMETAPETAFVRLGATVRFRKPVTLAPRRFIQPSLASSMTVSHKGFDTGQVILYPGTSPGSPTASPAPAQTGSLAVTSDELHVATWNHGIRPDKVSNKSHAETQFINWLWSEIGANAANLVSIHVHLTHSPCELCAHDLCTQLMARAIPGGTTLQAMAAAGVFTMKLDYEIPYYGASLPLSTTVGDISRMGGALITATPIQEPVTLTDAQRALIRQGTWGKGERVSGNVGGVKGKS